MAGTSRARCGGYLIGSVLFLAGIASFVIVVVTLERVSPHKSAVAGEQQRARRSLDALHPDDVEVLYLSGIFSSIMNVTNINMNNHALMVLLPALEKFENVMVDESRKLRIALKNHERRIKYLEDFISRQSDNGVQNTQEIHSSDVHRQEIHAREKSRKKARIKVTSTKVKSEALKNEKKKYFRDKVLKETTKLASVDVKLVKNDTRRNDMEKRGTVLLQKVEAVATDAKPDVFVNSTSNSTSEVGDSLFVANISMEINSTLSLVDAVHVTEHDSVIKNDTHIGMHTASRVTNSSAEYVNTTDYMSGVAENVNNSTNYNMSGVTEYVSNSTNYNMSGVTEYVSNSTNYNMSGVTEYVSNSTNYNMSGVTEYVNNAMDQTSGVTVYVNATTEYVNDTTENITNNTEYVKNSMTPVTMTPVTTERVSIATTTTNPTHTNPSIGLASLERIVNELKGKVKLLEKPRSYLRPNSKKRIKGLEKRVSEMRRHYRRVRTRLNAQSTKVSGLAILQGIAYRDQPRDVMDEYEYKKAMLLRFDKLERKLSNYRDLVVRNRHEIRDLKGMASKQDHFITELQSGSDIFEHKTREITLNMLGVEQNMANLLNSLNGYVSDIRWEIRVMLDRVCGDNHLHC